MKKISLLITFLFVSYSVFSQNNLTYGIKAGLNFTGFRTDNGTNSDFLGLNIGGIAKMDLNKTFGLQGEFNLNSKGGTYLFPLTPNNPEIKLTYINLPILLKVHITRKFNFELGPEFGFLLEQKAKLNGETFEIDDVPSFDMSLNAGLSYEFEKGIFIQGRYGYGLTELFEDRDYKNSCISLSLGYFFK
ncbi:porin family protein [Flavobacterium dankookense]|uniref:Outer membrane protein with beta-barrel domain n=1 Tax=Flavobacterium dankookense TaxID=706186 RepID=A0A4R6QB54_9FLAO|nr:porin family protein [Flavobacterium dankookense]TDP59485.1 outer membrane protein with beta-barrel domain [Flavobacterium dankookense]